MPFPRLKLPTWLATPDDAANRRRATRHRPSVGACNLGIILDLSATGARIGCKRHYKPAVGKRVGLTVQTDTGDSVTIPCAVCWTEIRNGLREAGLEFTATSARDLAKLAHMVTSHADQAARDQQGGDPQSSSRDTA